jgi:glycosyltransferase involved in cell wall biosynthesis
MKVSAVIPAYNEAARISSVLERVRPLVDELIVVDDGSADDTFAVASSADVVALRHAINRGQGAALKTGTVAALERGADIVVHLDADGQHDPDTIALLVAPIREGKADVAFGSRFLGVEAEGMPASRRLLLQAARLFSAFALGIPRSVTDPQSGLRAMNAKAARQVDFRQDRMAHCSEILRLVSHSDLRVVEVPTRVRYTADTLAKGNKAMDAFGIVWQLFIGTFQR